MQYPLHISVREAYCTRCLFIKFAHQVLLSFLISYEWFRHVLFPATVCDKGILGVSVVYIFRSTIDSSEYMFSVIQPASSFDPFSHLTLCFPMLWFGHHKQEIRLQDSQENPRPRVGSTLTVPALTSCRCVIKLGNLEWRIAPSYLRGHEAHRGWNAEGVNHWRRKFLCRRDKMLITHLNI